jgi:hypothetical protein
MHWRTHPKLKGRFLAEHPNDLQVIIHDGGPRITDRRPEAVWVTVTGCDGDIFIGRVLNQPTRLRPVQQGQQIRFIMPTGSENPVLVTEKYLQERQSWRIHPCQKCGFSELFGAPSDLKWPGAPATMELSIESIRDLVHRTVRNLGLVAVQPLGESLLTRAGYYVGREFRFRGVRAVWMASQGQIKFHDDQGQLLRALDLGQADGKRAA